MQDLKIDISNVLIDLEASTNEEALSKLSDQMYQNGYVKESYKDAVIERERSFATGFTNCVLFCGNPAYRHSARTI